MFDLDFIAICVGALLGIIGIGAALAPDGLASFGEGLQRFAATCVGVTTVIVLVLAWLSW